MATRCDELKESLRQFCDGAITYVEFVRYVVSKVTQLDVAEHNMTSTQEPLEEFLAEWPFKG